MSSDRQYNQLLRAVSSEIKRLRLQRGLTQQDMQDHGFNYRHYQKLESGKYSFNLYTLHRLAKIFRVKISDLLP